jgi:cysteine desulfurase
VARYVRQAPRGVIYLDYQATTRLAPEAAAAMRPWLEDKFANPHSPHRLGREAAAAVEVARERVAAALGSWAGDGKLYFTSGATEAINWSLKGAAFRLPPERRRIVTLATEHAAVLDTVAWLGTQGFEVDVLDVGMNGLAFNEQIRKRIDRRTGLVAAMLVNNEIGVIQPIARIARLARGRGALFFCDAVQGYGRVPLAGDHCDMIALSAHKVHGPKGIGALWVRQGVELDPLVHGGGQEGGLRSGTLSPALCVGFGEAARLLVERQAEDRAHVRRLWRRAVSMMAAWTLNGSRDRRYRGNLNLCRPGVDAARLISELRDIAFSAGSACASGSGRPSHVLAAIHLNELEARSSIRLGIGRYTTEEELVEALALIDAAANRQLSFAA